MPKTSKRILGDRGEGIACQFYVDHGFEIIDRNVAISHVGEIDIVAFIRRDDKPLIVFAEVKTRSSANYGEGFEAVDYSKRLTMRNCALSYLEHHVGKNIHYEWRLDVVSIAMGKVPQLRLFKDIEI